MPEDSDPEKNVSKEEKDEARERSAPSGKVVYHAIISQGEEELDRGTSGLFWSGIAAGMSMGFSAISEAILQTDLPDRPWRPLLSKLGYSVGFLIIILARQQLFTENTLTPILPLMHEFSAAKLANVMRLWATVFIANMIGSAAMAYALSLHATLRPEVYQSLIDMSLQTTAHDFGTILWRAVFAGWLIAMMVWLLPYAEVARIWVIILITYVIGISQFSHVIAGSVEAFTLAIHHDWSWLDALGRFIVPALIGNVLGGVTLVAALNYAQYSTNSPSSSK